jgi:hypothetical protein
MGLEMMDKSSWVVGNGVWGSVVSDSNWSMGNSVGGISWGSDSVHGMGNWSNGLNVDSWGGSVNDGVESVDWVSGVGNGTDGTIGLDKGVLSLDNISVAALVGRLLVSGEGIRDRVSVVVLWMGIVGLGADGVGNGWDGMSDSDWVMGYGVGGICWSSDGVGNWSGGVGMMSDSYWSMSNSVGGICWGSIGVSNGIGISQGSSWKWGGGGNTSQEEDGEELIHCDGLSNTYRN